MWNLMKKGNEECERLRDSLEESVMARSNRVSLEELMESLPLAQRHHITVCGGCREAAEDVLAAREIFKGIALRAEEPRPWFAKRVMAAIAASERELAVSPWTAVPRFASRLAWITGVVILVFSTWLYEKPGTPSGKQPSAAAAPESIFEAPQSAAQDDVLISMAESNP